MNPSSCVSTRVQHRLQSLVVLDEEGKSALQDYLNKGGNFVAIHSASDSLNTTAFYGRELGQLTHSKHSHRLLRLLIGAFFDYHPPISTAVGEVHPPSPILTQAVTTGRQCAHKGSPKYQYAPRQVGGHG